MGRYCARLYFNTTLNRVAGMSRDRSMCYLPTTEGAHLLAQWQLQSGTPSRAIATLRSLQSSARTRLSHPHLLMNIRSLLAPSRDVAIMNALLYAPSCEDLSPRFFLRTHNVCSLEVFRRGIYLCIWLSLVKVGHTCCNGF